MFANLVTIAKCISLYTDSVRIVNHYSVDAFHSPHLSMIYYTRSCKVRKRERGDRKRYYVRVCVMCQKCTNYPFVWHSAEHGTTELTLLFAHFLLSSAAFCFVFLLGNDTIWSKGTVTHLNQGANCVTAHASHTHHSTMMMNHCLWPFHFTTVEKCSLLLLLMQLDSFGESLLLLLFADKHAATPFWGNNSTFWATPSQKHMFSIGPLYDCVAQFQVPTIV